MSRRVLVVGGGIAGLACAWESKRRGDRPLLLEAGHRVGGHVRTGTLGGALFEHGPQGFLGESPGVLDVLDALGLRDRLLPASDASDKRYLLHCGRLVALPMSPPAFLSSPLLPLAAKLRVLAEPWARKAPDTPETVHQFASRRIGDRAAGILVDAAVTGIFAGDPRRLSVDACFPKMTGMEREHGGLFRGMRARKKQGGAVGKRLHSFTGGMEDLVRAMDADLGDRVRLDTPAERLFREEDTWAVKAGGETFRAPAVVVAVPPRAASRLLGRAAPSVAAAAAEITCAPVAIVGMTFRRSDVGHALDGYGFLVPGGRHAVLGCLFESTVFPNRAPAGQVLLRAMVGGARNPEAAGRAPEEIMRNVLAAVRGPLGITGDPVLAEAVIHPHAIPQYDVDHPARLARVARDLKALPGLTLAGAAWRGVSVNHLVGEAAELTAA